MHSSREHGYRKKVRFYAIGDMCQACGKIVHSRNRLCIHLEKNERCYRVVQACWPPMPLALVQELDQADTEEESQLRQAGWWASKAFKPAMATCTVPLPPADHVAAQQMHDKWSAKRPSDELPYLNLQGHRVGADTAPSGLWWTKDDLPAFVYQSSQGPDRGHGAYDMAGLAREASILHIRALVIVHFFSGFRRAGDIHEVIDQHVHHNNVQIFTISVDLCMQRQKADLATTEAIKWWTDRVHSGQIVSAGGGPPCETFTIARKLDDEGPKPLRSKEHPNGLPGLSKREWSQIHISDRLLRFLLTILHALAANGYSGFLEHPQYPTWMPQVSSASIWTLDTVRYFRRMHCVSIVSFDQCTCGALGRKPTTLLLVRLPEVRDQLLMKGDWGRCNHAPGTHGPLIGRQEDGTFHTAKAKIYPAGLNYTIGTAMFQFALRMATDSVAAQLPDEFEAFLEQCFHESTTVQPDFHGT